MDQKNRSALEICGRLRHNWKKELTNAIRSRSFQFSSYQIEFYIVSDTKDGSVHFLCSSGGHPVPIMTRQTSRKLSYCVAVKKNLWRTL